MTESETGHPGSNRARHRLHGFFVHLVGYFVVMAALATINLLASPETPWFVWPMVGWGGVLAFHVAFVMGLFGTAKS